VTSRRVRQLLHEGQRLKWSKRQSKPGLKKQHIAARLSFAKTRVGQRNETKQFLAMRKGST